MNIPVLTPRVEVKSTTKTSLRIQIGKVAQRCLLVRLKLAQDKALVSWQTISNAITLYESTSADRSFKVVRRNVDNTEAELLYERDLLERKGALRMKLHEAPRQEPAQGNLVRESTAIRLTPRNDHRVVGVPQAIVDENPTRRALIASLTKQVLFSSNKAALMKEPFPENGRWCTHMSEEAKRVVKKLGNVEALELSELTDTVQYLGKALIFIVRRQT